MEGEASAGDGTASVEGEMRAEGDVRRSLRTALTCPIPSTISTDCPPDLLYFCIMESSMRLTGGLVF